MRLRHSVIHGFKKEPQQPTQEVVKKPVLLDNDLPAVLALVSGIATLLGKRANNQVRGHFGDDGREGPFPTQFRHRNADGIIDEVLQMHQQLKDSLLSHFALRDYLNHQTVKIHGRDTNTFSMPSGFNARTYSASASWITLPIRYRCGSDDSSKLMFTISQ